MRKRHGRSADERSAAALRRLAVVGADLCDDGGEPVDATHPEMAEPGESPRSLPEGRHLAPSAPLRGPLLGGLHDRLPAFVHARLGGAGLTAQHVVVVVAVIVGFLGLAVWWVASSRPSSVDPVGGVETQASAPPSSSESAPPGSASPGSETAEPEPAEGSDGASNGKVVVDVTGKVREPGIVSLREGARVADAIEAAGGAAGRRVDLSTVNLARVLVDGEQIVVGAAAAQAVDPGTTPPSDPSGATSEADPEAGTPVNLNTATLEELDTLPGVGPVTGQAILDWRTENGQFSSVDELLEVSGIGEVTLAELRDLVTV